MNDGAQTTTAATSQAGTVPAAEPNTLEGLLDQFNKGTATPEVASAVAGVLKGIQPLVQKAERESIKEAIESSTKDMAFAVAEVKKAIGDTDMDDDAAEGLVRQYGVKHPEFEKAWNERFDKPDAWKAAIPQAAEWSKGKFKPNTLKADTLAARAAVQNSSNTPAPVQEISLTEKANMSDRDWNNYLRGRIGTAQRR